MCAQVSAESLGEPILGIDFGTSKVCGILHQDGALKPLPERADPILAYFIRDAPDNVTGEEARSRSVEEEKKCLFYPMAFLGRTLKDARNFAEASFARLHFREDDQGKLQFRTIDDTDKEDWSTIDSVIAEFLKVMKGAAEELTDGRPVTRCVLALTQGMITAEGTESLQLAAQNAGFTGCHVVSAEEASLRGIASNFTRDSSFAVRPCMLIDIGYRATHVTFCDSTVKTPLVFKSNSAFGGHTFDRILMNHCVQLFRGQHGQEVSLNERAMHRLRLACEDTKVALSHAKFHVMNVQSLSPGKHFSLRITQAEYEELCGSTAINLLRYLDKCRLGKRDEDPNLPINEDKVFLIGRGSRVPLLRNLIKWAYSGLYEERVGAIADTVTAMGAALLGADHFAGLSATQQTNQMWTKFTDGDETTAPVLDTVKKEISDSEPNLPAVKRQAPGPPSQSTDI
ncbi:putative 78 kDa glucose-regulated protein [Hypsibius exemplaris]|uniref:78 kDa glucose-regulated protein n=1 Tax=Hypsibius exemplaris TaxID=2072580 RepID=A0A1W0WZI6_HYPEX|nr:putative 78 kDa glucose-regulated protein [Hypsibius exemplaris]